jgi:hypothetical protein
MSQTPVPGAAHGLSITAGAWLCLLAFLSGTTSWLFASAFVSFVDPAGSRPVDYLLVARPTFELALRSFAALGLICLWQVGCARRLFGLPRWQDALVWPAVGSLAPLLLLILPAAALALVAPPFATISSRAGAAIAPPWIYLFIDMRWWLVAGICVLVAQSTAERVRATQPRFSLPSGSLFWELLLVATLLGAAFAFSPKNRFDPAVVGDEPKYVRYLENWYRGGGTNIEGMIPIQQLPIDYQPRVFSALGHVGQALAMIVADLSADARRILGLPAPPRPGAASSTGDAFVEGKRGGIYQVHNPGLSLLLLPGYFIDRFALTWASHSFAQGPSHLYATNIAMLSLYLLWGVGLFRLLAAHTQNKFLAYVVTGVALLSLPATAFSYQYYPEVAAGLLIVLVGRYVTLTDARGWPAFGFGVLAGFLPWLHVRFGYVSILAAALIAARSAPRSVVAFLIGAGVSLGTLCLYSYHITGSLLPFKVWSLMMAAEPTLQAVHPSVVRRLVGLWLDFNWGLLPHAPVYLLAMAGMWPLWQRNRMLAVFVVLAVLPLMVQSAAYNWHGSGTAPLRIVTAIVPLLAIPLADAVARFRRSRWFLVTFAVLAAISVDNGLAFNSGFDRARPVLVGPTTSGWLSRLAFPQVDTPDWLSNPLVIFWCAITLMTIAWPVVRDRRPATARVRSWTTVTATVLLGVAAVGSATGAWTGVTHSARFLRGYVESRDMALRARMEHGAGWSWSLRRGATALEEVFPNPPGVEITVSSQPSVAHVNDAVSVDVGAADRNGLTAWGTVAVDFGDGVRSKPVGLVGSATAHHVYTRPGDYQVTAVATMPGADEQRREARVTVVPRNMVGPFGRERIQGLPPDVMELPVTIAIDSVTIDVSRVELHCSAASRLRGSADYWVWLVGYEQGNVRARLHVTGADSAAADPRRFTLSFDAGPGLEPGRTATIIVGVVAKQGRAATSRSPTFSLPWPARELTTGSPIVVTAAEAR